jgi:protease-4
MRSFFKIFFASLLALIVFCVLGFFIVLALIGSLASKDKPDVASKSLLVLDLSQGFHERMLKKPLAVLSDEGNTPGLYDVIRLIEHAKTDNDISGIYIEADGNANGFAASNELRNALLDFRSSKKFIIAHGDVMTQAAYFVANAADKIYVNPSGLFEWKGFAISFAFLKGMLDNWIFSPRYFMRENSRAPRKCSAPNK